MKIAVLGYAGSGKTYLSDYISEKKKIPVLHLDEVKWDKEWKPIDDSLALLRVEKFMAQDNWIIDGYYEYLLMDERLEQADKIYLLLLPRSTCFFSALKRSFSRRKEGYKNDLNLWFIKFTLFGCRSKERQKKYADIAEKYRSKTVVFTSRTLLNRMLNHRTCNHLHGKRSKWHTL